MGLESIRAKPGPGRPAAPEAAWNALSTQSREAALHSRQRDSMDNKAIFARKKRPTGFARSVPIPYYLLYMLVLCNFFVDN